MRALKKIVTGLVLVGCILGVSANDFPPLPQNLIYGQAPGPEISQWIRINILGARDEPYPIVWISSQHFERSTPDVLVELSASGFNDLVSYVDGTTCPKLTETFLGEKLLQTSEYSKGQERKLCTMQRKVSCPYLSGVASMVENKKNSGPFFQLLGAMGCSNKKEHNNRGKITVK